MEKRKLAKIPREEATDEMVRFSERAAGTHIVTTKDIEKDLLMVTFYPTKGLKKGKREAQIRTFLSKNDYITQDLSTEKAKWLMGSFEGLECIDLYKYHWDSKNRKNIWIPNMFFWTDADLERMKKFFKEICLEEQPFVKDSDINVKTYVANNGGTITEMIRIEVGEGIEKKEENFAEEVAKQMNNN